MASKDVFSSSLGARHSLAKDKKFTISLDRWQQWRCGNGTLVQEETPTTTGLGEGAQVEIAHTTAMNDV